MIGHNSDPPTAPRVLPPAPRYLYKVAVATRQRWSTTRPWTSGARDGRRRAGVPFPQHSQAELSTLRQIDKHFEANGHGYPRPTRDQTDAPAPSPTPARATGSASHEGRSASGSRSSPDAASPVLNICFDTLVTYRPLAPARASTEPREQLKARSSWLRIQETLRSYDESLPARTQAAS